MTWFEHFEWGRHAVGGIRLAVRQGGNPAGPALLLLHGFPQTHAMWQRVAQRLRTDFFLVLPDLRGYGDSGTVPTQADHSNQAKRAMAQDLVDLMRALGHDTFFLCGHDRGGRVAHRLALDHPGRVRGLSLIDIVPTLDMYQATDMAFARAYYHWFHLIQPAPLPELMIGGNPKAYLHAKLGGWGSQGLAHIEAQALAEYERCFCRPEAIHSACEDYRASAGLDLAHDRENRAQGQRIACATQVLWSERGVVHRLFNPLALWQAQCAQPVVGYALAAGHFIPEEQPDATARALREFFLALP